MKYLLTAVILACTFCFNLLVAQNSSEIEVVQKKEGESIIVSIKNNGKEQKEISLHIDGKGTCKIDKSPIIKLVKVGEEITFVTLTPYKGKKLDYSIGYIPKSKPTAEEVKIYESKLLNLTVDDITDYSKGIIVFGNEACPRSEKTTKYLIDHQIDFRYINLTKSTNLIDFLSKKLQENSIKDAIIKMPVIIVDGKLNCNISNLDAFIKGLSN